MPNSAAYLALNPVLATRGGMFWQVFTYQFVHGGMSHLLSNMIGLFFFGVAVERRVGSKEFLLLYLLSGTLSGALSLAVYQTSGGALAMRGDLATLSFAAVYLGDW